MDLNEIKEKFLTHNFSLQLPPLTVDEAKKLLKHFSHLIKVFSSDLDNDDSYRFFLFLREYAFALSKYIKNFDFF